MEENLEQKPEADLETNKNFSWKRIAKISGAIVLVFAIAFCGYLLGSSRGFKVKVASLVKDNNVHLLPCEDMPFYGQAQKAFESHKDTVEKLKQAGATEVGINKVSCPTLDNSMIFAKGEINISYKSHQQRIAIENILGKDFFGIPYNGYKH